MKDLKEEGLTIKGSGGGSKQKKQHTPVEQPNTLRAKVRGRILDVVAYGPIKGLVNGLKSVYLDDTPVENEDGTSNFQGITLTTRYGTPDQDYIPGFRAVENTREINTEVKFATPVVRSMTNNDADAVAVTVQLAALVQQKDNGDAVGYSVSLSIDVRKDGGGWQTAAAHTIKGKTSSPFPKTFRIDLKKFGTGAFDIRVRRTNQESDTNKIQDKLSWTLLTEIVDRRFSYPNIAAIGLEVDSELFGSQMPARSYDLYFSITKVPSNWDPETRLYSGIWDGTFKEAYHDNPAWAYYDLATHPVIGADLEGVDKWELYRIGQYCDELVPDGFGGMEPRFTINTVFAAQEDATNALNTLASVFRGMTYWGNNSVIPVADMPEDPILTVGPGSVKDGDFAYTGTSIRERHSVAVVMWNDPDDMGKAVPEVYEDPDSIAEFGWRETRVTAVGCNSRGQARRMAMWILDSERHETQTLDYIGTTEHAFLRPGNIIEVADPFVQGARMSGRLLSVSTNQVRLDKAPNEAIAQIGGTWYLSVMRPDLTLSRHMVSSVVGDVVHLVNPLVVLPLVGAIWGMYSAGLQLPYYRVVNNREDSSTGMYQITATEYDPNKYSRVELGMVMPERPTSLIPTGPLPAPGDLEFKVYTYFSGTARQQGVLVSWSPPQDVRVETFVLDVKDPSSATYRTVYTGPGTSFDLRDAEAGNWSIRVRAIGTGGRLSNWTSRTVQIGQMLLPTPPDSVTVALATFSITLTPISGYDDAMWEFWRSTVALTNAQITSNAQQLATGPSLVDANLKPDTQYFYYIRGTNQYGKSAWFGVQGKTLNDFDDIMDAVIKDVTDGELYQLINSQIDSQATQIAIDAANGAVGDAMQGVNTQLDNLNQNLTQVALDLDAAEGVITSGLADANAQITTINGQVGTLRTDLTTGLAAANNSITSGLAGVNSQLTAVKGDVTAIQGSLTTINATAATLRADLTTLQGSVTSQVAGLQGQINAALDAREYNKANAYTAGQFISVGRALYQAKINVPAKADGTNSPPNATYWRDAGQVISSSDGLAARVTSTETSIGTINGTLTSQAATISGIQTTLNGKADASALTALTTRVTAAEGSLTSQGSAITNLTNTVAGKADASAVTALTTRVTATEGSITSLSSSLTSVQATLGAIGGAGSNMLPAEYSAFAAVAPATSTHSAFTVAVEADAATFNGYALKITNTGTTNGTIYFMPSGSSAVTYAHANMGFKKGKYILSYYARTNVDGHVIAPFLKSISPDNSGVNSGISTQNQALTTVWTRYSAVINMTAGAHVGDLMMLCMQTNASVTAGRIVWLDKVMIEPVIGENTAPSAFILGNSFRQAVGLASAQTALDARVTAAEGVNTSQATSITNLNSSLAGKADAAALSTLTTRVSAAEGSISSQGSAITSLTNTVAGKADSSTLTALSNTVTAQGNTITAQGAAVTNIQASLDGMAASGANLVPSTYSWLGAVSPALALSTAMTVSTAADASVSSGYRWRITRGSTGTPWAMLCPSNNAAGWNVPLTPGKYLLSMYLNTDAAGVANGLKARIALWDGSTRGSADFTLTEARTRCTAVVTITADTVVGVTLFMPTGVTGDVCWIDSVMVERQVGNGTVPSAFVSGPSAAQLTTLGTSLQSLDSRVSSAEGTLTSQGTALTNLTSSIATKADASALTALTTRVTAAEGVNTSQATSITNLTSGLAGKADNSALTALTTRVTSAEGSITSNSNSITTLTAGLANTAQENLLQNPDFLAAGTLVNNSTLDFKMEYFNRTDAGTPANAPAERMLCMSKLRDVAGWGGQALLFRNNSVRTPVTAGDVLNVECQMFCENPTLNAGKIAITYWTTGNSHVNGNVRILGYDFAAGGWQKLTVQVTVPATCTEISLYVVPDSPAVVGFKMWLANIRLARQTAAEKVLATATSQLDTRVTSAEGTITSQGSAITSLNNTVGNKADVSALNALSTRVTAAEGAITSQAGSITSLSATVNGIGGSGTNLLPAEYSVFGAAKPDIVYGSVCTVAADALALNGYALKVTSASATSTSAFYATPLENYASYNMAARQGKYILSYYAKAEVAGHVVAFFLRTRNSADVALSSSGAQQDALTTEWARYSQVIDLTGASFADKDKMTVGVQFNRSGVTGRVIYFDRIMLEPMIGTNTTPSVFSLGNSFAKTEGLATATSALDARVTAAEGVNTSQATSITNLTSSLSGKADASALTALTTRVTAAEGVNTSQASSITNLNTSVAGKADSSTVTALSNTVTAQGNTLTTQGSAITSVQATLGGLGGSGSNLVEDNYSWVTSTALPALRNYSLTSLGVVVPGSASGFGYQLSYTGTVTNARTIFGNTDPSAMQLPIGKYIVSFYASANVAAQVQPSISDLTAANVSSGTIVNVGTTRARYSTVVNVVSERSGYVILYINRAATAGVILTVDSLMVERQLGDSTAPSGFTAGPSAVGLTANVAAVSSLTGRMTSAEGTLTSQAGSLTNLSATVSGMTQDNLVVDPTFAAGKSALIPGTGSVTIVPRTDATAPAAAPSPRLAQWAIPASASANTYGAWLVVPEWQSEVVARMAWIAGEVYEFSCDVFMDASGGTRQHGLWMQSYDAAGVALGSNWIAGTISTKNSQWETLAGEFTVPAGVVTGRPSIRVSVGSATNLWVTNLRWTRKTVAAMNAASAASALDARVTAAEGVNTSQATSITSLNSTVAGKADASALTALTTRVTAAEGVNTSQGTSITNLNNSVAGKADTSALTALTTRVTAAEGSITSLGSSLTSVQATLGNIGGTGTNMLPAEYTAFSAVIPSTSTHSSYSVAVEADSSAFNGYALKVTANNTSNSSIYWVPSAAAVVTYAHANMGFKRGKYLLSYYARANVAGHIISPFLKVLAPDNANTNSNITNQNQALTTSWARYSAVIDMQSSGHTGDLMMLCMQINVSVTAGRIFWLDKVMLEPMIGDNAVPSAFTLGNSFRQAVGQAAAQTALEARVTAAEGVNTSQATSITNLTSSLAGKADAAALTSLSSTVTGQGITLTSQGNSITALSNIAYGLSTENLVRDPTFYVGSPFANNSIMPATVFDRSDAAVPAGASSSRVVRLVPITGSGNIYNRFITLDSQSDLTVNRMAVMAGETYHFSIDVYKEGTTGRQIGLWAQPYDAANASISHGWALPYATSLTSVDGEWVTLTGYITIPATAVTLNISFRVSLGTTTTIWLASPKMYKRSPEQAAQASAITSLDSRVTAAEGSLSSQGSSITALQNSLSIMGGTGSNLVPIEYSTFKASGLPAMIKRATTTLELVAHAKAYNGYALKATDTLAGNGYFGLYGNNADLNLRLKPSTKYIVSCWGYADEARSIGVRLRYVNAAGAQIEAGLGNIAMGTAWGRWSTVITTPAALVDQAEMLFFTTPVSVPSAAYFDCFMVEEQTGQSSTPSSFVPGPATNAVNAQADAITSLTTRVTSAEGTLTTQANATTAIQSTLSNLGGSGVNLLSDTYSWLTSTVLPTTTLSASSPTIQFSAMAIAAAASGFGFKFISGSTSNGLWFGLVPSNNAAGWNIPLEAGTYLVSFYAASPGAMAASVRANLWDGSSRYSSTVAITSTRTRYSVTITVAAATKAGLLFYPNMSAISGTEVQIDSVMIERMNTGATALTPSPFVAGPAAARVTAQAAALTSLDTRVTSAEGVNTSQASSITSLTSRMGTAETSITTTASTLANTNGALTSMWAAKIVTHANGKQYYAGMGVSMITNGGVTQSEILMQADRFALINTSSGQVMIPFYVENGTTYINTAVIKTASIGFAHIGQAQISHLHIIDGHILTAKIADAAITTAKIGDAQVDTLRIAGNAVTVPTVLSLGNQINGSGVNSWHELATVTVYMDQPGMIFAQFGAYQGFGSGIRRYMYEMLINGQSMATGGGDWADGFPTIFGSIWVAAGWFTITVRWWGENAGVQVYGRTLYATGAKR